MADTSSKLTSAVALRRLGGENPFSIDTVRERSKRSITFPEVDPRSLTKQERKIYRKAREDAMVIGLAGIKGQLGVGVVDEVEDFASASFARTTGRIEQRLRNAHAASQDEEFQAMQRMFAVETVKRMGGAMAAIVDSSEHAVQEAVDRELSVAEDQSLLRMLFSGRRT